MKRCEGPLIWRDADALDEAKGAIIECGACGYFVVTGNFFDERHSGVELLKEGLA